MPTKFDAVTICCSACGEFSLQAARFCSNCGGSLSVAPKTGANKAIGERRQITFLFADLIGSVRLIDSLDPEDLLDTMGAYHQAISSAVDRFNGHVVHIAGDGMMACFGYPVCREDGPLQAIDAGLAIMKGIGSLDVPIVHPKDARLSVRVGIATGIVVTAPNIGLGRIEETSFIGAAPNIASRLQHFAGSNEVLIAASTYRLVGDAVSVRPAGPYQLKGFDQPVQAYVVTGRASASSRLERRLGRTRTPMVNRTEELALLLNRWQHAVCGEAQVVSVLGEAGIGKSRLLHALHEEINKTGPNVRFTFQCSAALSNTALHPFIEHLQRLAGISATDPPAMRLSQLLALMRDFEISEPESLALLAALLSVPGEWTRPLQDITPHLQRQRTFGLLIRLLRNSARREPVLVVFEDLHWLDPASSMLLEQAVAELREARLLLVCTSRLGAVQPWIAATNVTELSLSSLSPHHASEMVAALAVESALPRAAFERIVTKAGGVPLYLEELTRMMLDPITEVGCADEMPDTLLGLLTERLDQLGPARAVARIGAAVGGSFSIDVVAASSGMSAETLQTHMQILFESGLVEPGSTPGTVTFKHALVRDAAYATILLRDRREMHRRIADAIIKRFPAVAEAEPEVVARHFTIAKRALDAATWWLHAAQQAISRGAPRDAVAHFEAGLEALSEMPTSERRMRMELALLAGLGPTQMVLNGPGHLNFGSVQRRAFETTRHIPDHPALFEITYGLALFHWARAEFNEADTFARHLRDMSMVGGGAEHIMAAHIMAGMICFHRGATAEARRLLSMTVCLYDLREHAGLYPRYMMDFGVFSRFYLGISSFIAGAPEEARAHAQEAGELATTLNQPHSRGFAMLANLIVAAWRRDAEEALVWAEACVDFARIQGFPEFLALALIVRGWALGEQGDAAGGLAVLEEGFSCWKATGFENWQSCFGDFRANLLLALGRTSEALAEIEEQERRVQLNGEGAFRSLLASSRARALAEAGFSSSSDIEALHRKAIAIAANQQALSWELRCALAFARWLAQQDRAGEALTLLAAHLNRFDPSAAMADLSDARTLVEHLTSLKGTVTISSAGRGGRSISNSPISGKSA